MRVERVGVVIPCRNEASRIEGVLEGLLAQVTRPSEVVVVDDGSTDGTRVVVEQWADRHPELGVRVVAGPGAGIPAAVNRGIEALSTDIVVRLDGHCHPEPGYLDRSVAALTQEGVGVVGGIWLIAPGATTLQAWSIAKAVSHQFGSGGARYRHESGGDAVEVDTVPFGCFRRALWAELGGLDEALKANEDYDFNTRVRQRDLKVLLDPSIRCVYYSRPTLRTLSRQYWRYGWWKARMLTKHPGSLRWRQAVPALLLPALLAVLLAGWLSRSAMPLFFLAGYAAVLGVASSELAIRHNRPGALPWLVGSFAALQISWSAGFWVSSLRTTTATVTRRRPSAA